LAASSIIKANQLSIQFTSFPAKQKPPQNAGLLLGLKIRVDTIFFYLYIFISTIQVKIATINKNKSSFHLVRNFLIMPNQVKIFQDVFTFGISNGVHR
jgi:hypothetical protein